MSKARKERRALLRQQDKSKKAQSETKSRNIESLNKLGSFYKSNYKKLIIIPLIMFVLAIILISVKVATTGEFINKGISLSGGISVTVIKDNLDKQNILDSLDQEFQGYDINIRTIEDAGRKIGLLIESSIQEDSGRTEEFIGAVQTLTGAERRDLSIETVGSSLGDSFFKQTMIALIVAFILMGAVLFLYFRHFVPSSLTIMATLSDIVVTIAILNLLNIKIGTAGIAAFLMLIGYSVDANIVLNMRVLKSQEGSLFSRVFSAMRTGLTMSVTTLAAILTAFIIAESPVLREIMLIMLIGLLVDMINTWLQNAGLLVWYLEKNKIKNK